MRIALASLDQQWHDKDVNFSHCRDFARDAARAKCQILVFPEMTLTGYSLEMGIPEREVESMTMLRIGQLALETGMHLVFGVCLVNEQSQRPRNMFAVARPDGEVQALYAKVHPFSFAGEDKVLEAGDCVASFVAHGLRIGCAICYDLRFPELYAAMAQDCDAIITIANWPQRRIAHWRTLLVARAIENQLFSFGVNRIGSDGNGLSYEKSSMAVSPEGTVLSPVVERGEMDIYEINPDEARSYRDNFPTVRDKRLELYRTFLDR